MKVRRLPKTTIDQWLALESLVENGSYEAAATALQKSPSAVSYQISRLKSALHCGLLEIRGRRAVLTNPGAALLERARALLDEWQSLEAFAQALRQGNEPKLRLVVDKAFPRRRLLPALKEIRRRFPRTQVDLSDAVLSGAEEAIVDASADLVISARVPSGALGEWLCETTFVAVSSPDHPLQALGRSLTNRDLARHPQVVLRDSGQRQPRDEGFLGSTLRWTVGGFDASVAIVEAGLAYAWLPEDCIRDGLAAGTLRALPLEAGVERKVALYAVLARAAEAGPVARAALEILRANGSA